MIGEVTEHDVRPLAESEFRAANTLFMAALNNPGAGDAAWTSRSQRYEVGRVWGDFVDGELSGTTMSMPSAIAVPGGAILPAAAVTGVGVRADKTRRGVLTSLMRAQLDEVRERGEPVAMLHASETEIYGRFGYGMATRTRKVSLDTHRAALRPEAPDGGRVRLVEHAAARKLLPEIYQRLGLRRPGTIARTEGWWETRIGSSEASENHTVFAVHSDRAGDDDGFAIWVAKDNDYRFGDGLCTLQVSELQAADTEASVGLWRFLLGIDLADTVVAIDRPVDEPLEWWLTDRRQCRVRGIQDDLWIRLVDVRAALEARTFGPAEPVVIEVRDAFLPQNSGNYRIGAAGAVSCDQSPQISVDVDMLGSLYLGDVSFSTLAAANRITVHDPGAITDADRLFATSELPWCGTGF